MHVCRVGIRRGEQLQSVRQQNRQPSGGAVSLLLLRLYLEREPCTPWVREEEGLWQRKLPPPPCSAWLCLIGRLECVWAAGTDSLHGIRRTHYNSREGSLQCRKLTSLMFPLGEGKRRNSWTMAGTTEDTRVHTREELWGTELCLQTGSMDGTKTHTRISKAKTKKPHPPVPCHYNSMYEIHV